MVAFLDKWFEFTSSRSLDECEQVIGNIPKLKRVRIPGVFRVESRKKKDDDSYKLCQYTQRGTGFYYAEMSLDLLQNHVGLVTIRGYGRVRFLTVVFYLYFVIVCLLFALIFRHILISAILGIGALFSARGVFLSFQNRNQLIEFIYENLA